MKRRRGLKKDERHAELTRGPLNNKKQDSVNTHEHRSMQQKIESNQT